MRIVFFGTGAFGEPSLKALSASHDVALVVTQPDKPRGRGMKTEPTHIKLAAEDLALTVYQPVDVNAAHVVDKMRETQADLGVVIAYGQKIGQAVREAFTHRCVNLHASLLPKWRGAAPIQWAVLSGDAVTGVCVFELVDRMDAGPIITTAQTEMLPGETSHALHDRLAVFGVAPLLEAVQLLGDGRAVLQPQDESLVTKARKLSRDDSRMDFSQSAGQLVRQIHGLWSWPGAQAELVQATGRREKVVFASVQAVEGDAAGFEPGQLCSPNEIACGEGRLRIVELKPMGKTAMSWSSFANGRHIRFGHGGDRFAAIE